MGPIRLHLGPTCLVLFALRGRSTPFFAQDRMQSTLMSKLNLALEIKSR